MKHRHILLIAATLLCVACGTKKPLTDSAPSTPVANTGATTTEAARLAYVEKVGNSTVAADNIVAGMSFNVKTGSRDLSMPGSLRMRKNEVIRLQITVPLLGSEVARVEFTPDYVLVVDRLHKEYVKAHYADLDFLADNGIDFYALQALFWNQLHVPGKKTLAQKDLKAFDADPDRAVLSLGQGKMSYTWKLTQASSHISETDVRYAGSASGTSELQWQYDDFKPLDDSLYPTRQHIVFSTNATTKPRQMEVNLQLGNLSTSAKWDALTTVSAKYKEMDATLLLKKILSL